MPNGRPPEKPNSAIVAALNALRGAKDLKVLDSPIWFGADNGWAFPVEITSRVSSPYIPASSRWFITVADGYPSGEIRFFPAKEGGVVCTFPHQALNVPGANNLPWRAGKLCLESQVRSLGGYGFTEEPHGDAELRMLWYADRAGRWIEAAEAGTLLRPGDPFELPEYPNPSSSDTIVIHDECPSFLSAWTATADRIGRVVLGPCPPPKGTLAVYRYETFNDQIIREGSWRYKPPHDRFSVGAWWIWPRPIVLEPWQAPITWGDLRTVAAREGVDMPGSIQAILSHTTHSAGRAILLLGFPIPQKMGEESSEIHWNAVELPVLRAGRDKAPRGFRNNAMGSERKCQLEMAEDHPIRYLKTRNWHSDRLNVRGRYREELRNKSVGIVGMGSLGSAVAELLARGGLKNLVLVDGDSLEVGNLSRHVLTLHDLALVDAKNEVRSYLNNKAKAVADRLLSISPHLSVVPVASTFPTPDCVRIMETLDVLIDCTASDGLLASLASVRFRIPKLFVSLSLGFRAKRLYCFATRGTVFPAERFRERILPWMEKEMRAIAESDEVFEGAGCWSPLFPARYDDVLLAAATAVKQIEAKTASPPLSPSLVVFEQKFKDDAFVGYEQVDETAPGGNP